jgi:hypothetical protein
MDSLQPALLQCPYCGEEIELLIDGSVVPQEMVEDCGVCCRPILVRVNAAPGGELDIEVHQENE